MIVVGDVLVEVLAGTVLVDDVVVVGRVVVGDEVVGLEVTVLVVEVVVVVPEQAGQLKSTLIKTAFFSTSSASVAVMALLLLTSQTHSTQLLSS